MNGMVFHAHGCNSDHSNHGAAENMRGEKHITLIQVKTK